MSQSKKFSKEKMTSKTDFISISKQKVKIVRASQIHGKLEFNFERFFILIKLNNKLGENLEKIIDLY